MHLSEALDQLSIIGERLETMKGLKEVKLALREITALKKHLPRNKKTNEFFHHLKTTKLLYAALEREKKNSFVVQGECRGLIWNLRFDLHFFLQSMQRPQARFSRPVPERSNGLSVNASGVLSYI
jgi:hypothetical protein